jgi:peptide/nickel transport system substrate-binding protein
LVAEYGNRVAKVKAGSRCTPKYMPPWPGRHAARDILKTPRAVRRVTANRTNHDKAIFMSSPARYLWPFSVVAGLVIQLTATHAAPQSSIAMHGVSRHASGPPAFAHVRPDAPKGGRVAIGVLGTYNSLNPLIYKGDSASGIREYVYESLLARGSDEPFTLHGLIAETIDVPDDRSTATFVIRPEARFSNGTPITMRATYSQVTAAVKLGERQVRFEFGPVTATGGNRELPLLMGLMPILSKAATDPDTFEQTSMTPPIGSGPYLVARADAGRTLIYRKNPDWWARDLPIMRGRFNFDEIRNDYFRDSSSLFEAFKSGQLDVLAEEDPTRWATGYAFPAVAEGRIAKAEFITALPSGMSGFVFNTRRPLFKDARVRAALIKVFDAEWVNTALYAGLYRRTQSYFDRSELSSAGRPMDDEERRLLAPFPDAVTPAIADGTATLPKTSGTGANRDNQISALKLLREAGYQLQNGKLVDATGTPVKFEVLITSQRQARLLLNYVRALEALGITLAIREVDSAQYESRLKSYDFDMTQTYWNASLSPGNEQWNRWGRTSADTEGQRNYAGAKSAAIDAMIEAMVRARDANTFRSAVRAFDRLLRSGDYVIPLFHPPKVWIAHWTRIKGPDTSPNSGFDLDTWWAVEGK